MTWNAARSSLPIVFALLACGDGGAGSDIGGAPGTGGGVIGGAALGGAGGDGGQSGGQGGGQGGGGEAPLCGEDLPAVSFAKDVQPIFTQSCAKTNCHRGSSADEDLELTAEVSHSQIVGVETSQCSGDRIRIVPGDPDASYLFDKIRGVDLCGDSDRMPAGNTANLTDAQTAILQAWICNGAPND